MRLVEFLDKNKTTIVSRLENRPNARLDSLFQEQDFTTFFSNQTSGWLDGISILAKDQQQETAVYCAMNFMSNMNQTIDARLNDSRKSPPWYCRCCGLFGSGRARSQEAAHLLASNDNGGRKEALINSIVDAVRDKLSQSEYADFFSSCSSEARTEYNIKNLIVRSICLQIVGRLSEKIAINSCSIR